MTIACGGNDPNNGNSFEAAQLLAKRGADVLAHSSLLNKAFGGARATELIETAADLPPTSIALTENLRKMLDEAHISEDTEGKTLVGLSRLICRKIMSLDTRLILRHYSIIPFQNPISKNLMKLFT